MTFLPPSLCHLLVQNDGTWKMLYICLVLTTTSSTIRGAKLRFSFLIFSKQTFSHLYVILVKMMERGRCCSFVNGFKVTFFIFHFSRQIFFFLSHLGLKRRKSVHIFLALTSTSTMAGTKWCIFISQTTFSIQSLSHLKSKSKSKPKWRKMHIFLALRSSSTITDTN